ncbi:DUF4474 domain-containing protein [Ruminiclostridium cellobioparum]|uniref:DUF4474 domain-containing protein n=1 Tax=Ruminiclostridium cellobioparum TaxID=29355 RepID=UPI000558FAD1|nr:DUF4474 domain-containing protein [Ruminiclostridium cellobioparum]
MLNIPLLTSDIVSFNLWFSIFLIAIFAVILSGPILYEYISYRVSYRRAEKRYYSAVKKDFSEQRDDGGGGSIDELIGTAGYAYNQTNDLFFSTMYAWQRSMGYCRLYDEAAAPLGMIIDSEPIRFSYAGRRWLIEFWKGQYGMTTGCELGVYSSQWPDLNIPGVFDGTFYTCASNEDRLYMGFVLYKNGEELFNRKGRHWWLTAFKLGEYSEPSELSMDVYITLKSRGMRDAFLKALQRAGYKEGDYEVRKNTVALFYDKPHSRQPYTRSAVTDKMMLAQLKRNCDVYQTLTKGYTSMKDKIKAVKEGSPELYTELFKIGKTASIFSVFDKIKDYLNIEVDGNQLPK